MSNYVPAANKDLSTGVDDRRTAVHKAPMQNTGNSLLQKATSAVSHKDHSSNDDVLPCHNVDKPPTKYKIKSVPSDFLNNSDNARKCVEWIEQITECRFNQELIDDKYK